MATHLVPSFHYDIEYLFSESVYQERSYHILLEAHRLLSTYPKYTFRIEQVYLLETFLQEYPNLREDFVTFAKEGRLEVSAGMYTMADINLSGSESILRQMIVGKEWCRQALNLTPDVLDMGDCTGHPASMPQIARACGYTYYVFERAIDDVSRKCEMQWEGIDGTRISTYWLAVNGYAGWGYISGNDDDQNVLEELTARLDAHCHSPERLLAHGGDFCYPYERGIKTVEAWNQTHDTKIMYSTYTRALHGIDFLGTPVETCEWNPDRQGCYSSRMRLKQNNRICEALLFAAEAISAFAELRGLVDQDFQSLERAWKLLFVNQFHDIYWGTICDDAYHHALERIDKVTMICTDIIRDRLKLLSFDEGTRNVVVFNSLPWPRECMVEIKDVSPAMECSVQSGHNEVTHWRKDNRIICSVQLPGCGYQTLSVKTVKGRDSSRLACSSSSSPNAGVFNWDMDKHNKAMSIETPIYRVCFGSGGVIKSLYDKRNGHEYVDQTRPAFNALCCQTDRGDLWQYYEGPIHDGGPWGPLQDRIVDPYPLQAKYTRNGKRLLGDVIDNRDEPEAEFAVDEVSPERIIVQIRGSLSRSIALCQDKYHQSIRIDWMQTITFYRQTPRIDFHLETHHIAGQWYRLRAGFFTDIRNGNIEHEIPFGRFNRPEGEYAAQNFLVYYNNEKGMALINRGIPGNNVTDGVMMLSLMRSVNFNTRAFSDKAFECNEKMAFDYALLPFAGKRDLAEINLARMAMDFVHAPLVFDSKHKSEKDKMRLPPRRSMEWMAGNSLIELESNTVVCTAIYMKHGRLVVRLYESRGIAGKACIVFGIAVKNMIQTNALLEEEKYLRLEANKAYIEFKAFEIKTLSFSM